MKSSGVVILLFLSISELSIARELVATWPPDQEVSEAEPGDVVLVRDGIYRDAPARLSVQGKEGQPVVVRPVTPGGVVLNGTSSLQITNSTHLVIDGFVFDQVWGERVVRFDGCRHVRVTNCAFIESGSRRSTFRRIVEIDGGSRYCRADHLFMRGNLSMGVGCPYRSNTSPDDVNSHNTIDHNWFKDIVRRRSNGQEAMFLGGGMTNTPHHITVEYNLFDNASGDAEVISNKSGYNIIRYNTFRNCNAALVLRGGRNVRVEGNYFFDMQPGLRIYGTRHEIVNNHIQDCRIGIVIPTGTSHVVKYYNTFYQGLTDTRVAHNTLVNCDPAAFQLGRGYGTTGTATKAWQRKKNWDGNTTYNRSPKNNRFERNLVALRSAAILEEIAGESNLWQENVYVWQGDKGDTTAVATDIAESIDVKFTEKDGVLRPVPGSAMDAGCDYTVLGGELDRPLTPQDVGPDWMNGDPEKVRRVPDPKTPPKT